MYAPFTLAIFQWKINPPAKILMLSYGLVTLADHRNDIIHFKILKTQVEPLYFPEALWLCLSYETFMVKVRKNVVYLLN